MASNNRDKKTTTTTTTTIQVVQEDEEEIPSTGCGVMGTYERLCSRNQWSSGCSCTHHKF